MSEDRNLIAYCGLYCGDCFSYQGKIADLARDLRKELRLAKFDRVVEGIPFKGFQNYQQCYEVLGAMVRLRCKKTCRDGGGNPFCKIRQCCEKNELAGCWECDEFEDCRKLDSLQAGHGDAHVKNLKKIQKQGIGVFLGGKKHR